MAETRFTKGPWSIRRSFGAAYVTDNIKGGSVALIQCLSKPSQGPRRSSSEIEANASLISAAPDLYEALEKIVIDEENRRKKLKDNSPAAQFCDKRLGKARVALAKAKGET